MIKTFIFYWKQKLDRYTLDGRGFSQIINRHKYLFLKEEIEVQGPLKLVPKFKILKTNKKNKHRTSA